MQPIHVFKAAGLKALDMLIAALLLFNAGFVFVPIIAGSPAWVAVIFFAGAIPIAVIWMVLPRRFEVWRDRLVIVFPVLFRWSLPFDTIERVEVAKWWHAYGFMGARFASNARQS